MLPGADAFWLYDTYGIPLDVTLVLAEEKGLTVDTEGYKVYMKNHKQQTSDHSALPHSTLNLHTNLFRGSSKKHICGLRRAKCVKCPRVE